MVDDEDDRCVGMGVVTVELGDDVEPGDEVERIEGRELETGVVTRFAIDDRADLYNDPANGGLRGSNEDGEIRGVLSSAGETERVIEAPDLRDRKDARNSSQLNSSTDFSSNC